MNNYMIIVLIGVCFYFVTCLAFYDLFNKNFGSWYKKVIWGFIVLIPFLGCIIYFLFGYRKYKRIVCEKKSDELIK